MIAYQERVKADLSDITIAQYTGPVLPDRMTSLHRHKFCEIIFISQGYGELFYCREHIVLLAGSLVFIAPEEAHAVSLRTGCEAYTCHFDRNATSEKLNRLLEDRTPISLTESHPEYMLSWTDGDSPPDSQRQSKYSHRFQLLGTDKDHILSILQALETEQNTQDVGYLGMKQCYLEQLLITLNRILEGQSKSTMDYHSWKEDMVNSVLSQIEADITIPFDFNAFAQSQGITSTYFRSIFKSIVNMSPIDYLNHVRISKALELLQVTNLSISEIASRVGIYDANYFSRLFKKVTGYPPRYFKSIPNQEGML